jgi:hypothetical protein
MTRSTNLFFMLACLTLLTSTSAAPAAEFSDALEAELAGLAQSLKGVLDKQELKVVAVGTFTGSTGRDGNVGPEIQHKLAAILIGLKFTINPEDFQAEIKGEYFPMVHPQQKVQGVRLEAKIRASDGTPLGDLLPRFIFGQEAVPRMIGRPADMSPNADARQMSDAFKRSLDDPPVHLADTLIKTRADSPYAIEVLVKQSSTYKPRAAHIAAQQIPLVTINNNEVYAVRLINNSPHDAAVALTIDGLTMYSFSEKQYTFVIVPPKSSTLIKGWHLSNEQTQEFKVTEFPASASAKLKLSPSEKTGTICAAFSAAWTSDANKPNDESTTRGLATGFGDVIDQKFVEVKRHIGNMREAIVVRYTR